MSGNEPMLSKREERTGDEPMLPRKVNTLGLGKRQKEFLEWLQSFDEDVSWKAAWVWMGNRLGYLSGSNASQRRMHVYIGRSLWGLVKPMMDRGLLLIIKDDSGQSIRLLHRL